MVKEMCLGFIRTYKYSCMYTSIYPTHQEHTPDKGLLRDPHRRQPHAVQGQRLLGEAPPEVHIALRIALHVPREESAGGAGHAGAKKRGEGDVPRAAPEAREIDVAVERRAGERGE